MRCGPIWLAALLGVGSMARAADPVVPAIAPASPTPSAASPDPSGPPGAVEPAAGKRAGAPKPRSLLAPLPPPPVAPVEAYELRRADDGSGDLLYHSSGFDARIHRDGSVRFIDRHFSLTFFPWLPYRTNAQGPTLQSLFRGALAGKQARGVAAGGAVRSLDQPASLAPHITPYRPDPNEGCRYPSPCFVDAPVFMISVAGTFDLTDELMRLAGQDPYRYQKARFMKGTEALRVRLGARVHAEDLRQASVGLRGRLAEIAADPRLTEAERRGTIEALARETDTSTPEGQAARATIDDFARARFVGWPASPVVPASPAGPTRR